MKMETVVDDTILEFLGRLTERPHEPNAYNYERVFWDTLFTDALILLTRVAFDVSLKIQGVEEYWGNLGKGAFSNLGHEDKYQRLSITRGPPNTGLYTYLGGKEPPYTVQEVYDWVLWINSRTPEWAQYNEEFIVYLESRLDHEEAPEAGAVKSDPGTRVVQWVLHDHLVEVMMAAPLWHAAAENRRVKDR